MYNLMSEQVAFDAEVAVTSRALVPTATSLKSILVEPLFSRWDVWKWTLAGEALLAPVCI